LVLAFLRSRKRLASGHKRTANSPPRRIPKARYLLPFLSWPSPFPCDCWCARCRRSAQGRKVAEVGEPTDRTGFQKNDGGERLADAWHAGQEAVLDLTRPCRRFSRISICDRSVTITETLVLIAKPTSAASGILLFAPLALDLVAGHPQPCWRDGGGGRPPATRRLEHFPLRMKHIRRYEEGLEGTLGSLSQPCSPDFNPIEHPSQSQKRQVKQRAPSLPRWLHPPRHLMGAEIVQHDNVSCLEGSRVCST
jgi:hypothetical protein